MFKKLSQNEINRLKSKDCIILALESSCDETSCSLVKNGREVLSNIISSQIDIHKKFGGVVPEVASRNHLLAINNIIKECLSQANLTYLDIDAVAVTYGAGLVGALMVGVVAAKTLAFALNVPLVAVNHIRGHIAAAYLTDKSLVPPFTALVVSGGHTSLLSVKDYDKFKLIATTGDDAIGEAFDKVARVLNLPYPGGPEIDKLAKLNTSGKQIVFNYTDKKITKNFSYSGLKTAVINYVNNAKNRNEVLDNAAVADSFQKLAVSQVVNKAVEAAKKTLNKTLVVAGGVAANSYLRDSLKTACENSKIKLIIPPIKLCTDNAAMIGSIAYYLLINNSSIADESLGAKSNLPLQN